MIGTISATTEVIVIGGGPAGATTATLVAQKGRRVTLFERERFPRFHVGESLIPETFWVLGRLGLLDAMRGSRFVEKHSVQFVNEKGILSEPFYFADHKPEESSRTWQVVRSEFDELMLRNAAEQGVDVHEGTRVLDVLFDGTRATGVRIADEHGVERTISADVIVDASGQSSMIMSRLGLRDWDPVLKKAAIWTYWKGAERGTGRDAGATLVLQLGDKQGWFWYIPLHDGTVSVGVVAGYDYLFKDRPTKDPEAIYFEEVARCPGLGPRIAKAERFGPIRVAKEYSYRSKEVAGDGWVLVGDAFGFLDPLYSSGILLAAQERRTRRRRDHRRTRCRRHVRGQARNLGPRLHPRHGADAAAGLRVLRGLQFRPLRQAAPAPQGARHRPADRRPVQRPGGRDRRPAGGDAGRGGRGLRRPDRSPHERPEERPKTG